MYCKCFQCVYNSIHDANRAKGYCTESEDVEINSTGNCKLMKLVGEE